MGNLKVAIVHDWLIGGGAEHVVYELHRLYPDAPVYTSYCSDEWRAKLDGKVVTGYLQLWPFAQLRKFLPLLRQRWFRKLDLREFDLVISSSGNGEAKFIQTRKDGVHVCYCHTPPHFYWRKYNEYLARPGFRPYWLVRLGLKLLVKPLRERDYAAAQKVDHFIANSSHIQADIKKYYSRDSSVIHPPVDTERFASTTSSKREGFVTIGRQTPYKRTDVVVNACTQLNLPLTVVGHGPENIQLQKIAGQSVRFDSNANDQAVERYMASAEAFLFAAEEDFGIAAVEAMAAGTPVIAYKAGGALDYVVPGTNGMFFEKQTADSLAEALKVFNADDYHSDDIKRSVQKFSQDTFRKNIQKEIANVLQ